ncbi:protein lethal(2)essential for life-like [Diprion similis]|uniref:protein lethal(2)essential for life-like n=1 Tax=Diprion similis TaxID=362088 RepID=UPI001EF7B29C|nr:protein lethal(2)essential for life-like [Diprion similis]
MHSSRFWYRRLLRKPAGKARRLEIIPQQTRRLSTPARGYKLKAARAAFQNSLNRNRANISRESEAQVNCIAVKPLPAQYLQDEDNIITRRSKEECHFLKRKKQARKIFEKKMSLIPLLFSNWWEDLNEPHSLVDQHFGVGLNPEQLLAPSLLHGRRTPGSMYYRPWGALMHQGNTGSSVVKADKDQFKVILDVQQFKPDEINVKVVDKCVVVEAKHEEKRDEHGWVSRQFERRYLIPDQCNVDEVSSSLSSDGILTITAPRKEQPKVEGERSIKIQHTGKPAVRDTPKAATTPSADAAEKQIANDTK